MSLVSVKEILRHASQNGYAVPAFNIFNYESALWAVKAAERVNMPVIIQFFPGYTVHVSMRVIADTVKDLARNAKVPVGLHLDHARDFETAMEGIAAGFPSVMIDGSALPFEENAALTAQVRRVAKVFGVDVEAELGHVGQGSKLDDFKNPNNYTDPGEVKRFVELTEVDSLAVAVGNGHGHYVTAPTLDFDRITAIKQQTDIPLVMHGGSDIPDEQIRESVLRGMSKFNIATEYACQMYKASVPVFAAQDSHYGVLHAMEENILSYLTAKFQLLNPNGYKYELDQDAPGTAAAADPGQVQE